MSATPRGLAATAEKQLLVEQVRESLKVTQTMARALVTTALRSGRAPISPAASSLTIPAPA
jgi:hypothetical protein